MRNCFIIKHPELKDVEIYDVECPVPAVESVIVVCVTDKRHPMRVVSVDPVLSFQDGGTSGEFYYRITLVPKDNTASQPKRRK